MRKLKNSPIFAYAVMFIFIVLFPLGLIAAGIHGIIHPDFRVKRYAHFQGLPAIVFSSVSIFMGLALWRFFYALGRPGGPGQDVVLRVLVIGIGITFTGGVLLWILSPLWGRL